MRVVYVPAHVRTCLFVGLTGLEIEHNLFICVSNVFLPGCFLVGKN